MSMTFVHEGRQPTGSERDKWRIAADYLEEQGFVEGAEALRVFAEISLESWRTQYFGYDREVVAHIDAKWHGPAAEAAFRLLIDARDN